MYHNIQIGGHTLAQGTFLRSLGDGRIEIDAGLVRLSGRPVAARQNARRKAFPAWPLRGGLLSTVTALGLALGSVTPAAAQDSVEILNVSYDPTREFYREYNVLFNEWWTAQGNAPVTVQQSHGGAGAQARAVIDGLEATVVTLALSADIDTISERTGKIPADWQARLDHNSSPVNGGIKSGHWAAQKPATLGLGVTRAPRRRPVSRASQIAGG